MTPLPSAFVISLDFELHWGGFERWLLPKHPSALDESETYLPTNADDYANYFLNTRQVIPHLLRLFEQNEIHTTWATVGMLLNSTRGDLIANSPIVKPTFVNKKLSAYEFIDREGIGGGEKDDPFHFAASLVKQITESPFQELGTHTFAHYYCNEAGQTAQQFRADIQAAQRVAATFNRQLVSLAFPRNQFNDEYLKVCWEEGLRIVRSNPLDWFWNIQSTQNESIWKRINRGLDAYLPVGKQNTYKLSEIPVRPGFPVCLPSSRFLRPYRPGEFFLNNMKINRINGEMNRAAGAGEVYHLWWHPHNFGHYPQESLDGLKKIFDNFARCRSKSKMQSLNMGEVSSLLHR